LCQDPQNGENNSGFLGSERCKTDTFRAGKARYIGRIGGVEPPLLARVPEVYSRNVTNSHRFELKVMIQAGGDGAAEREKQRE